MKNSLVNSEIICIIRKIFLICKKVIYPLQSQTMTRIIVSAKPSFIAAIKAEIAADKEKHNKLFAQIKPETASKLKKMQQ